MGGRKNRDRGCCSVDFLKYVLFIFNIIFLFAGLAVLAVGLWTVLEKHSWLTLLNNSTFSAATYLLVSAGAVVVLVSVLGCCVISKEDRCGILMYTFLLLLIFVAEAAAGMLSYVYAEQVYQDLKLNLNTTFLQNYAYDIPRSHAIDAMQQQYQCCGAIRFEDWKESRWIKESKTAGNNTVPDSCCKTVSPQCGVRNHPSNIYYDGCIHRLVNEMQDRLIVLGAVGLGLCLVQVFGVIFTCCLYFKLGHVSESTY